MIRLASCWRHDRPCLIADVDNELFNVSALVDGPIDVTEAIVRYRDLDFFSHRVADATRVDEEELQWRPVIPAPRKILCVGRNYAEHARETGAEIPSEPLIFCKLPTTVAAHEQPIALPPISNCVDFEAELVVVIGEGGRNIPPSEAMRHVAGYTCGNDLSARDWQKSKPGGQWLLGKSFDDFCPIGPWIVAASQIADPHNLGIRLRLNGRTMQDARTSDFIFTIDFLIHYISTVCTLEPGDLLFTGTPEGVGVARIPPLFLQPGDEVEVEIEGVGCLRNRFVARR